jgi:hypothetical protein
MSASFWIDFAFPDDTDFSSSVPVASWDGQNYHFDDVAYDVLHHTSDEFYAEWERIVCTIIAPKLAQHGNNHAVSFNIRGESWTFLRNDYRDENGRPFDAQDWV